MKKTKLLLSVLQVLCVSFLTSCDGSKDGNNTAAPSSEPQAQCGEGEHWDKDAGKCVKGEPVSQSEGGQDPANTSGGASGSGAPGGGPVPPQTVCAHGTHLDVTTGNCVDSLEGVILRIKALKKSDPKNYKGFIGSGLKQLIRELSLHDGTKLAESILNEVRDSLGGKPALTPAMDPTHATHISDFEHDVLQNAVFMQEMKDLCLGSSASLDVDACIGHARVELNKINAVI